MPNELTLVLFTLTNNMQPHHINDIVITAEQIAERVDQLVTEMEPYCRAENFVMIGILRGSFMFLADLVRDLYQHGVHPRIDFLTLESYGSGMQSSGTVKVTKDITVDVQGADVVVIDDILDSGRTLHFATDLLKQKGASRVLTCTLLDKPERRVIPLKADFVGFTIPDEFVVGYGLDYDSRYRELPYIAKVTLL
ncbi:MAG TPA: hypoxanthine phosphoribosyltransferase [Kiritimatiellia bacterium]|nr:hypoxanthine phosphoribosyltransferase [Kiritimatiellia bacterium]